MRHRRTITKGINYNNKDKPLKYNKILTLPVAFEFLDSAPGVNATLSS